MSLFVMVVGLLHVVMAYTQIQSKLHKKHHSNIENKSFTERRLVFIACHFTFFT